MKIKSETLLLHILILFSCVFFWIFKDIDGRIFIEEGERITNLSRYYIYYNSFTWEQVFNFGLTEDPGYYISNVILSKIGIPFPVLLFFIFYLFLFTIIKIFYQFTKLKKYFLLNFFLIILALLWMDSLIGVAFRQGCAFILLCHCFFLNKQDKKLFNFLIFLIAISFHFSAIIFILIFFINSFFKQKLNLLDIAIIFFFILYVLGNFIQILILPLVISDVFNIDLRSSKYLSHTTSGFSIFKFIALLIPYLFYKISYFRKDSSNISTTNFLLFYTISLSTGVIFSELSYHDRWFLYAWGLSPIMLIMGAYSILVYFSKAKSV